MADSLSQILSRKNWDEPDEVTIIKEFVRERYKTNVGVQLQDKQIIIVAASAALAGSLRMQLHELKTMLDTDKRLSIRIGK